MLFSNEAAADIEQIFVTYPVFARTHAFQSCSCAYAVQTQEQALLERRAIEILPGRDAFEDIGKAHTEVRLLEHVEEAGHGPTLAQLCFQHRKIHWFRLGFQRGEG